MVQAVLAEPGKAWASVARSLGVGRRVRPRTKGGATLEPPRYEQGADGQSPVNESGLVMRAGMTVKTEKVMTVLTTRGSG